MHIPIKTIYSSTVLFKSHFLAKSGICFFYADKKRINIYGFGFSSNKINAQNSSQYEALERLYATYEFQRYSPTFDNYFSGVSWINPVESKNFILSDVLLGPLPNSLQKPADANGLGCHQKREQAAKHAVLELIERHLLANIWYGDGCINQLGEEILPLGNCWRLRYFNFATNEIPFAVVVVDNQQEGIWVLGSAVRETFSDALEHAKEEAFMLLESAFMEQGNCLF